MENKILNLDDIDSEYSFIVEGREEDKYFCSCGEQFISSNEEEVLELSDTLSKKEPLNIFGEKIEDSDEFDDIYGDMYKDIKLALDKKVKCPHCEKNFSDPDVRRKLIPIGAYFISGYDFKETDTDLIFYYAKACPATASREFEGEKEYKVVFDESIKYIRFEKESKKLVFQDFGDTPEVEFDLDEAIKYVDRFFIKETNKVIDFMKLHMYVNRLANFVSDTKNSEIVSEFLESIRSAPTEIGMPYMKKLLAIFYGIIKYSNLSTVALTKGSQFLYDLMLECDIPSSKEMEESGATSPVGIFNFLVTKYINKLNEEVNEDNKDVHDFAFKSKQRIDYENAVNKEEEKLNYKVSDYESEVGYKINLNKNYKGGKVVKVDGKYQVMDAVDDGTISKFIYNHIENFSQYKQIIKYFKFYDKKGVISLLQRHNLDLLTHAIDTFYFRDKMEPKELDRVLCIIDDFIENRFFHKDYKNVREFSFVEYDDARMMMEIMQFDPKKHFNKIKTYEDLVAYHDNLVTFYKVKSEEEKTGAIKEFVSKFRFLESKGENDYEGPLEIHLLDSPGLIIKEGIDMRHSASQYAPNVAQGNYLMATVYNRDPKKPSGELERFTIGFKYYSRDGLEFDQVKGFANEQGSNRFKNLMMEYLTDKDVSFRPIKDLKLSEELEDGEEL
jgi:hypothetical protein